MPPIIRLRNPEEPKIIPNGEPKILGEFRIGAVVSYPVLEDQGEGFIERNFEKYVRSPGSRIIAVQDNKIYLHQESRVEKNNIPDWRLPGGKVVDTFEEYKQYMTSDVPTDIILAAAAKELREEAHLQATSLEIFTKKDCGATVQWDLYYVVAQGVTTDTSALEHREGETIANAQWFSFDEVRGMCERGEISEGRSAAVLIEYIAKQIV